MSTQVTQNRLRDILYKKGITSYRLAKMVGRRTNVISRAVSGIHIPKDDLKQEIADALDMEVSDIFYFSADTSSKNKSQNN